MIFGKKRQEETEQRDRIIQYKRVFGSEEGKAVLMDLMNRFHILSSTQGDQIKEGQRTAVIYILNQANVNLAEFDKMMKGESGE